MITVSSRASASSSGQLIPPELFQNILACLDENDVYTRQHHDVVRRRRMVQRLAAIASTCLYWANKTRQYMFRSIILHSPQKLQPLVDLLRCYSSSRLLGIGQCLREVVVVYKFTDYLWCHSIERLEAHCAHRPLSLVMFVSGHAPSNVNTQRSVRHPLFHTLPKVLPINRTRRRFVRLHLHDIHFEDVTGLVNLISDFSLAGIFPLSLHCRNITWSSQPPDTLPPLQLRLPVSYASRTGDSTTEDKFSLRTSHCTDHITAAYVAYIHLRGDGITRLAPFLELSDYFLVFDITRILCHDLEKGSIEASCGFTYQPPEFGTQDPHPSLHCRITGYEDNLSTNWTLLDIGWHCGHRQSPTSVGGRIRSLVFEVYWASSHLCDFGVAFKKILAFPALAGITIQARSTEILANFASRWRESLYEVSKRINLRLYHWTDGDTESHQRAGWAKIELEALASWQDDSTQNSSLTLPSFFDPAELLEMTSSDFQYGFDPIDVRNPSQQLTGSGRRPRYR